MFERFTDRARRAVVLAQEEARLLNHNYIGTEHLLLGLIHEGEGVAAEALESLGLSLDAVRASVEETVGQGPSSAPSGHIPFTPNAKKAMEGSLREALTLGHDYIGTEHLLLGLLRVEQGVAAEVLGATGVTAERTREIVLELLEGYTPEPITAAPPDSGSSQRRMLERLLTDEDGLLRQALDRLGITPEQFLDALDDDDGQPPS